MQMDLTSKIGIAVSGCKNGYAVLATDNIDSNSPLLKQGLRDQRSYMRVTEPGHDFYTMVITKEALVLSACRSSVDAVGSSGGFIAVSIFVPVSINVHKGATLLHSMLEAYWAEYMHPMFGTPLRDKFEDAYNLRKILNDSASSFSLATLRYRVYPSDNALPPLFMEYTSIGEVDAVMANPWHKQYSQGGELIFVPRGFLNSSFVNHNLETIKMVNAQRMLPASAVGRLLLPPGASFKIADFKVDGKSYSSPSEVSLNHDSNISFAYELPDGNVRQYSGTVRQGIGNTIRKKGDDYELLTPKVNVSIRIKGLSHGKYIALSNGHTVSSETKRYPDGTYEFRIPCAGFPYSLVEVKNNRVVRTLVPDAFTAHSLNTPVREIDLTTNTRPHQAKTPGIKLTRPMLIVMIGVAVLFIAFLIWLFVLRTPQTEDAETQNTEAIQQETIQKEDNKNTETHPSVKQTEAAVYIVLPYETLKEKINPKKDYLYRIISKSAGDISDISICKNEGNIIIKVPERYIPDLVEAKINILKTNGAPMNEITLNKTTLPDGAYEDLIKYPHSKLSNYVVRPEQEFVSPEKWEEYKNFNPSGKVFDAVKPVSASTPTPAPAPAPEPQPQPKAEVNVQPQTNPKPAATKPATNGTNPQKTGKQTKKVTSGSQKPGHTTLDENDL